MNISFKRIWAIIYRHAVVWPRDLEALTESFWWPSLDILIYGFVTVYVQSRGDSMPFFTSFIIGGIVLWMVVYRSSQDIGVLFLKEFWDRNLLSMLATPLSIGEFFIGTITLGILKLILSSVYMSILAYAVFSFNIFLFGWYLIPFVLTLLMVGWWSGFFVMGLVIRWGYRVQALAWSLIIVLTPFSGVYYPVKILPGWMQTVSIVLPTRYVFEGMREVILTGTLNWSLLLVANMFNAVFFVASILFFFYSFRKARESGMIVKFG